MDTPDRSLTPLAAAVSRPERVFPTLTQAQITRIAPHGRRRPITSGDVLVEVGQRPVPFFVVLSGEIQVLRPSPGGEALIVTHRAGQFTGEGNMLTGRRALARTRVSEPGEVLELEHEQLLGLIQTDAELVPNTGWLGSCIALDEHGFIRTGPDLSPEDLTTAAWPLVRAPYLLETNRPGVFAVGDVRGGNIKRVASAVGEGSIAVAFVHQVLRQ